MDIPMDGPKLPSKSFWYRREREIYDKFNNYPDVLILLKIPLKVSIARKPDEHDNIERIENLGKKIEALKPIESLNDIHIVDATAEYSQVKRKVQSIIWSHL